MNKDNQVNDLIHSLTNDVEVVFLALESIGYLIQSADIEKAQSTIRLILDKKNISLETISKLKDHLLKIKEN